jgi:hypothetical protein
MERYSGHTNEFSRALIGNWFEDKLKSEAQSTDVTQTQGVRNAELRAYEAKLAIACQSVALCDASESQRSLRFGDVIQLRNAKTDGVLSTDADKNERVWRNGVAVLQSTTSASAQFCAPMARNAFVIVPPTKAKRRRRPKLGDTVHYAQPFALCTHSALSQTPFFLHSQIVSHLSSADSSRAQIVVFHPAQTAATNWQLHCGDHTERVEKDTTPVLLHKSDEVVLKHCSTQSFLASDSVACGTDFGAEFQTECTTHCPLGRIQIIQKELDGLGKDARGELKQNKWRILDQNAVAK